jgi:hypothetical protein
MVVRFLLALLLGLPSHAGLIKKSEQSDALPADKFVEQFLKVPVEELEASEIEDFLTIDPKVLPKRLQRPYEARKLELFTLRHLAYSRKKGLVRTPDKDCSIPMEAKSGDPLSLKRAGYMPIGEDEEQNLIDKTKCTERELMCETTLQVVIVKDEKTGKVKKRRYFLYPNDPLMPLIAAYREGKNIGGNTNFFSQPSMLCTH